MVLENTLNSDNPNELNHFKGERKHNSGEEFQQWSIDDTQAWFYCRSSSKESSSSFQAQASSSGSSGIDIPPQPPVCRRQCQKPRLHRYISEISTLQPSTDSRDKDLILPMPPYAKFSSPSLISKNNADSLNAERRRKYYQNRVCFFDKNYKSMLFKHYSCSWLIVYSFRFLFLIKLGRNTPKVWRKFKQRHEPWVFLPQ